jgi:hypothetical protein
MYHELNIELIHLMINTRIAIIKIIDIVNAYRKVSCSTVYLKMALLFR